MRAWVTVPQARQLVRSCRGAQVLLWRCGTQGRDQCGRVRRCAFRPTMPVRHRRRRTGDVSGLHNPASGKTAQDTHRTRTCCAPRTRPGQRERRDHAAHAQKKDIKLSPLMMLTNLLLHRSAQSCLKVSPSTLILAPMMQLPEAIIWLMACSAMYLPMPSLMHRPAKTTGGVVGILARQEGVHRVLLEQTEFRVGRRQQLAVSANPQSPHGRATHHAAVADDENRGADIHLADPLSPRSSRKAAISCCRRSNSCSLRARNSRASRTLALAPRDVSRYA